MRKSFPYLLALLSLFFIQCNRGAENSSEGTSDYEQEEQDGPTVDELLQKDQEMYDSMKRELLKETTD